MSDASSAVRAAILKRLQELCPGARLRSIKPLGPDAEPSGAQSDKQLGYGRPLRLDLDLPDGTTRSFVFHTAAANDFGHDRRADRASDTLLAYDTFALIPRHVRAVDVGAIEADGSLLPLQGHNEFYLMTDWAEGHVYAEDLRRIALKGRALPQDLWQAEELARYLAELHQRPGTHAGAYTRAIRDLVGHGEGIAGIVDGYPDDTPGASRQRLQAIERSCLEWRFRLRHRVHRLRRTHGDFHPFNIIVDAHGGLTLLDTSRGSEGDPADDVACLSINYLFFGLEHREHWPQALGRLWERFFATYLAARADAAEADELLSVLGPFYAWRALVVASPQWYPHMLAAERDRILRFAERALAAERFDPSWGPEAMA